MSSGKRALTESKDFVAADSEVLAEINAEQNLLRRILDALEDGVDLFWTRNLPADRVPGSARSYLILRRGRYCTGLDERPIPRAVAIMRCRFKRVRRTQKRDWLMPLVEVIEQLTTRIKEYDRNLVCGRPHFNLRPWV
jgi:hypothetical protein